MLEIMTQKPMQNQHTIHLMNYSRYTVSLKMLIVFEDEYLFLDSQQ